MPTQAINQLRGYLAGIEAHLDYHSATEGRPAPEGFDYCVAHHKATALLDALEAELKQVRAYHDAIEAREAMTK